MVAPLLRPSRFFRALVLTTTIGSLLVWLYIVARVVVDRIDVQWPFVDSVPTISVSQMGAFSFGLFCVGLFLYLWLWGRFDRRSFGQSTWSQRDPEQREP